MVKENTHIFIAHETAGKLSSKEICRIIFMNINEYYLGSVIPDAFFYCKKNSAVSEKLHSTDGKSSSEIIFMLLDSIKKKDKEGDLAFIFGYLTHCAADIAFHPMVHFMSGNYYAKSTALQDDAKYSHNYIETYIDSMLNDKFYISEMLHEKLLKPLVFTDVLAGYMHMKQAQMRKTTMSCFKRQLLANRYFRSRAAYALLLMLNRLKILKRKNLLGLFYADLRNKKKPFGSTIYYKDPVSGDKRRKSLGMLVDEAVNLSAGMIKAAFKYHSGQLSEKQCRRIIQGLSLETGMAHVGVSSMKHFADAKPGF